MADTFDRDAIPSRPFLLMEGGPLFSLQKRVGLIRAGVPFTKRRALLAAIITWLPLFVLSAVQGRATGPLGGSAVSAGLRGVDSLYSCHPVACAGRETYLGRASQKRRPIL